ncbi:MAG: arginine N-succinyltransferase [Piscirickettsiaceae bacterium]|nr:MAG: arginine N-succinyltransferase [Piscirickettsiaceae bacterium]PCI69186.1 MAG: arginine N-succinyltransferase [Piscirickettsiaceae bacterium]
MDEPELDNKKGCLKTMGIVVVTVVISVILTVIALNYYLFPKQFSEVELTQQEEIVLNQKLKRFGLPTLASKDGEPAKMGVEPEAYTEVGAKREVSFSEKEVNAMLARNTDLAEQMAIDLSDNLASVKIIIPLDPDFPLMGGKTLKVNAGAELAYKNGRPIVILKGVSLWGVPVPNAWLGNLKNVDLVSEFGGDAGFWKSFSEGVENIQVKEGNLTIKLKE